MKNNGTFMDAFRTFPFEAGDKIKHINFGVGVVIAVCNGKMWVIFENGHDRLIKFADRKYPLTGIEILEKSIL